MSKLMRTSLLWFSTALALIFTLLLTASVQAYTIYARVWPNANTTYRRDASYSNIIGWNAQADVAVADWNPWFQFNLNNASGNILQAADLGANGFLGVTNATESGHHRTSFTITMNTNKLWHSGAPPVPFNRFDLRSVLRHEFGHALGLWHSGGANTLMNSIIPQGASRLVEQDAQNGANFLYNPAANPPIPEGPGLSSVISSGTADDASPILYPFIGYKSGSWVAATNWPRAYVNTISWSNSNQAS